MCQICLLSFVIVVCAGQGSSYNSYDEGPVTGDVPQIDVPQIDVPQIDVSQIKIPVFGNDDNDNNEVPYFPTQQPSEPDYPEKRDYSFSYGIEDPDTGNSQGRYESRDGDVVTGEYSLVEPDGFLRKVIYTSDPKNGFRARVEYIPPADTSAHHSEPYQGHNFFPQPSRSSFNHFQYNQNRLAPISPPEPVHDHLSDNYNNDYNYPHRPHAPNLFESDGHDFGTSNDVVGLQKLAESLVPKVTETESEEEQEPTIPTKQFPDHYYHDNSDDAEDPTAQIRDNSDDYPPLPTMPQAQAPEIEEEHNYESNEEENADELP